MNWEIVGIIAYVCGQLGIGAYLYRFIKTEDDYFLAGRGMGPVIATFSIFATWFGAETCIGSSGAVYTSGLSGGRADPFGYSMCLALMGLLLATRMWKRKLVTLGDLYRQRYSMGVEKLAVITMLPTSVFWAGAQIRAFGQIVSAASHLEVHIAITLAALLIIFYTSMGGLLADAISDLVQSLFIVLGLGLLVFFTSRHAGGLLELFKNIPAERLSLVGPGDETIWSRIDAWAVPIFGSLVAQELISRVLAARSPKVAQMSSYTAAIVYFFVGMIPVFMGLVGPALAPGLEEPEQLLPTLAKTYLPVGLYILLTGALISAILSTVDSTLLAISALFSHNLVFPLRPNMSEKAKVKFGRLAVLGAGLIAYGLAISGISVFEMVELSSSFGGAGICVITLFALLTPYGNARSAYAALIGGFICAPLARFLEFEAPFLLSMLVCTLLYVGAFLWEKEKVVRPQLQ